jgi:hypothetical protein
MKTFPVLILVLTQNQWIFQTQPLPLKKNDVGKRRKILNPNRNLAIAKGTSKVKAKRSR